jgi:hypothetical protein
MAIENISQDVADLLATKDYDVKYTDGQGKDSSPEEAKTFAFDWVAKSGQNYGTVVIVLGDDNDLQLFFGDNLGKTMENPQDKLDWFGSERETGFLPELKNFATQHRYTFSPKDINQLKHTMQGMAAIKEGLFEGYYGTRKVSYVGEQTEARLVIKHNRMIGEDDKRYRYVESLFIETAEGERFKLPFVKLSGGRAMLEHVKQGGRPYDIRGQHINEIVSEMAVLSRFNRASQQRVFEGVTQELVETVQHYYSDLRESLQHMATGRGYQQYFESWTPADIGDETALVEDLKTMFIEQTLDARIEAALPTLAKIQQRGNAMKEAQIFENWVNNITEGTWALPDTPEAQAKLNELMSQELIVGPDATNATEQLYDIIGDDQLFDILSDLAEQDPRANIWDDTDVQARLQELGIQLNTTPDAEQQQPVAPAAGEQAPGTSPEQDVAEGLGYSQDPEQAKWYHEGRKAFKGGTTAPSGLIQDIAKKHGVPPEWLKAFHAGYQDQEGWGKEDTTEGQLDEFDIDTLNQLASHPMAGTLAAAGGAAIGATVGKGIQKAADWYKNRQEKKALDQQNAMAENTELNTMLKYAGVPVVEGTMLDESGNTWDHLLDRFRHEVEQFKAGGELDHDLYDALFDYYSQHGAMPYGVAKGRTGDPFNWVSERLAQDLGVTESNSGMIMPEGNPIATVEAMPDLSAPVTEGSCNATMEGEYCPEHGLAECGMYEMGTVAGSVAPVMGEQQAAQDPINYNGAITGSYYESKDGDALLARIKSLALLK